MHAERKLTKLTCVSRTNTGSKQMLHITLASYARPLCTGWGAHKGHVSTSN